MGKFLGILVSLLVIHFSAGMVRAVIISEVHPNPLSGPEWVEIYNETQSAVPLSGWWLEDQLASPSIIFHSPTNLTLAPQQYYVASLPTSKLNNDADGVTLKDQSGAVIDTMSYTSTQAGKSWARLISSPTYFLSDPTPGTINPSPPSPSPSPLPTPSPSPSPSPVPTPTPAPSPTPVASPIFTPPATIPQPSEIMACPDQNQNEWVELYNPSTQPITLTNWHLIDDAHNSRLATATIPANGYQIIEWASAMLNNTGDTFSLVEPDGTIAWTVSYDACSTGQSLGLQNDEWVATSSPTPNQPNQFPSAVPEVPASPIPSPLASPLPTTTAILKKTLLSASPTPSPSSITLPAPQNLHLTLDAPVDHPFATPSATLNIRQATPNLPAIFSVIIGSALLLMTNLTELYFYFSAVPHNSSPHVQSPHSQLHSANLFT